MSDTTTEERPTIGSSVTSIGDVFRMWAEGNRSPSWIGRRIGASHLTVEAVLSGDKWPEHTVDLRARYGTFARPVDDPLLTAEQFVDVFRSFYDERTSLSEIGRRYDLDYQDVRRVLEGKRWPEQTVELRAEYGDYEPRGGPWQRKTSFSDKALAELFSDYHTKRMTVRDLSEKYDAARSTIEDILAGRKGTDQTGRFTRRYGTQLRPRGRRAVPAKKKPSKNDAGVAG